MSDYRRQEYGRATAWKHRTSTLPETALVPAAFFSRRSGRPEKDRAYPFCLPVEHAVHNLLPEVREPMLELFSELGIPWHEGVADGPGNHLLSSQVQCANALGQMVADPIRIVAAFGSVLGIDQVLEVERGRYLTFEYIGPTDYFGEAADGQRTRGARCTSVDAAFLHRDIAGAVELVLVEWKYTESYPGRAPEDDKEATRRHRYQAFIDDPDGPIRADVLPIEQLFVEPIYQLVRQQLLASCLERDRVLGADRVRVVHVCPPENTDYQDSLTAAHRRVGGTVREVWQQLRRQPDRYTELDPPAFLDPAITSDEYCLRYGQAEQEAAG